MAEDMYPSEVSAGVNNLMFGGGSPAAQPDAPSWSMGDEFSPSRFENAFYKRFEATNNRNAIRTGTSQAIRSGIDLSTFKKTLEDQKQAYDQLDQEYNNPVNVDMSRLNGLQNQYATNMTHAPMAPQMVQPQVNDTVAGVSALAGLLSPQRMRGSIAMAPFQAAQLGADRQNQQNQQAYGIESQNFGTVMKGLAAQIDQEAEQVKQQYGVEIDKKKLIAKRMNDLMDSMGQTQGQMVGAQKSYDANTIRRHTAATTEWKSAIEQAKMDGEVTQEEYDALAQMLPKFLEDRGVPVELADSYVMPTVGKTANRMNQDAGNTRADTAVANRRLANDRAAWLNEIKFVNMDGRVTKADIAHLIGRAKEFSPDHWQELPMPVEGTDWHVVKSEADTQLAKDRLAQQKRTNLVKEGQGQARVNIAVQNANTATTREKRLANGDTGAGADGGSGMSAKEINRNITRLTANIDGLRAKQRIEGDQKKKARYEIEIQGLKATRDSYQGKLKNAPSDADAKALNTFLSGLSEFFGSTPRSKNDKINTALAADMIFSGYKPTIGTANTGHSELTKAGYPSRHKKGNAVDITAINGIPVSTPQGKKLADEYVRMLEARGYTRNSENGNDKAVLWQMGGHYDHIHVSRNSGGGGVGIPASDSYAAKGDNAPAYQPKATKPAESKPSASKGATPPKQVNIGGQKFNRTK